MKAPFAFMRVYVEVLRMQLLVFFDFSSQLSVGDLQPTTIVLLQVQNRGGIESHLIRLSRTFLFISAARVNETSFHWA